MNNKKPERDSRRSDSDSASRGFRARPSGSTSQSLIGQLQHNREEAWNRMVLLYRPLVAFWVSRTGIPDQDVDDIVQDVFQTVARSIGQFSLDRSRGTFRGWLRTISNSRSIDWQRKNRNRVRGAGGSSAQLFFASQPFDPGMMERLENDQQHREQHEIQQVYLRALTIIRENFREKTWQAFWQVVVEGRSPGEVAAALAISPSTVRVAKSRVLHRLRLELGDLLE